MPAVLGPGPPYRSSNIVPEILGVIPLDDKFFSIAGDHSDSSGVVAFHDLTNRIA